MRYHLKPAAVFCNILFLGTIFSSMMSQTITLPRPGAREFVIDKAGMIDSQNFTRISETCDRLMTDHGIPIVVVTIESMKQYASRPVTIEEFASALYNQWGIGYLKKDGKPWNKGMLLLISRLDRKARIELGSGYAREKDEECRSIMADEIIPYFKQDRYSEGTLAGVIALDKMARENEGDAPEEWFFNPWFIAAAVVFAGVLLWMILTKRSGSFFLARMGAYAVGGLWSHRRVSDIILAAMIGVVGISEARLTLGKLGWLGGGGRSLYIGGDEYGWRSHSGSFFSGGFSSGGFSGGGFSGGGGASGSW